MADRPYAAAPLPTLLYITATRTPARERGQTEWLAVLLCPSLQARICLERNRRRKDRSLFRDHCRMLPHGNGPRGQAQSAFWGRFGACPAWRISENPEEQWIPPVMAEGLPSLPITLTTLPTALSVALLAALSVARV